MAARFLIRSRPRAVSCWLLPILLPLLDMAQLSLSGQVPAAVEAPALFAPEKIGRIIDLEKAGRFPEAIELWQQQAASAQISNHVEKIRAAVHLLPAIAKLAAEKNYTA